MSKGKRNSEFDRFVYIWLPLLFQKNKQHHVNSHQSSSSGSRTLTPLTDSEEEELASVDNGPLSAEIKVGITDVYVNAFDHFGVLFVWFLKFEVV